MKRSFLPHFTCEKVSMFGKVPSFAWEYDVLEGMVQIILISNLPQNGGLTQKKLGKHTGKNRTDTRHSLYPKK